MTSGSVVMGRKASQSSGSQRAISRRSVSSTISSGRLGLEQRNRVGSHRLAAADRVYAFTALGLDAHLAGADSQGCSNLLLHARNVRGKLRALESDSRVEVHNHPASPAEKLPDVAKKQQARGVVPLGRSVGEMAADVAQSRRAQQRVTDGVGQAVAVRMAEGTFGERNPHAAQNEFSSDFETVHGVADAGAMRAGHKESQKAKNEAASHPLSVVSCPKLKTENTDSGRPHFSF